MISLDELDRIRSQITNTKEDTYQHQRDMYRKTLQETSKARVQNWPNTMEAMRVKREDDRIKRLEDDEVSQHSNLVHAPKGRICRNENSKMITDTSLNFADREKTSGC